MSLLSRVGGEGDINAAYAPPPPAPSIMRIIAEAIQRGAFAAERPDRLADEIRQSFADWAAAGFFREILSPAQTA